MASRQHVYALTNAHGLRLSVQAARLGIPPNSAASPLDAASLYAGFVVASRGRIPRHIEGARGEVIGLELVAARLPRSVPIAAPASWSATAYTTPLGIDCVRRIHFASQESAREFVAGLEVLEEEPPVLPPTAVSLGLFVDERLAIPAPTPDLIELSRRWRAHLDRQGRVSSARLVGAAVAGDAAWSDECLEGLRLGTRADTCTGEREIASAFARLDPIEGWTGADVVALLSGSPATSSLAEFASALLQAQDPFGDVHAPAARDDGERSLELLLGVAGLSPRQQADELVNAGSRDKAPRAAALAALAIGRHLLPRSLRRENFDRDLSLEEIAAVSRTMRTSQGRAPRRSPQSPPGLFD